MTKNDNKKEKERTGTKVLSIYGYTDYRKYLKDYYHFRKDNHKGYSYRLFSKSGNFSSPNILKLVIDGERNLSTKSVEGFITALNLEGQMAEYFRNLVKMNQADNDDEKSYHYDQLIKLTPNAKKRELGTDTVEYLSHYLYPVLREMIQLDGFREDPYWIAQRLIGDFSVNDIMKALSFLEKHGFIKRDENGKLAATDNMVASSDEVKSLAIRQYHRKILEQAKEILSNLEIEDREFGALTFLLPESSFEELKYKLKEFRQNLHLWAMQISSDKSCDSVIQVNLQMYPQTKRTRK
ncbi:MAG: TIGR02147 family protein [Oligoflexales bacterium]|nr:TIGR02147 family protein [Oligoflexales bacterium]